MPETEKPFDIHDYIQIALRRKWYIVVPLVCSLLISFGVYKYLPKVYKATTLILVQPQKVPETYIRPTITDSIGSRLNTISQEILSRTRLEKVIEELNLFPDLRRHTPMEGIIEIMRKAIEIKVLSVPQRDHSQASFTISFEGKDPHTVMMVTNKLASLFIEENLKVRESQAERTSEFLTKELHNLEDELKRKEEAIRNFKERNMGQLPQQLDTNLRVLERLQDQLKTASENMRAAEDRIVLLQNQIEQLKGRARISISRRAATLGTEEQDLLIRRGLPDHPLVVQLENLKRELSTAQSKYKESHPDVIDLKRRIAALEPKVKELLENEEDVQRGFAARREGVAERNTSVPALSPETERLLTQYTEQYNSAVIEAKRSREEIRNLKEQIALYQRRIEDTPKREQELVLLTRDYDLLKANYQSLLDKRIQAQMAENLERKQQGEQFKVLDPARLPEKPVKPDRNKILLMGAVIGLAAGLGLAWFRESLDRSFHSIKDVEVYLAIPVIATIPNLERERRIKVQPRRHEARGVR